MVMTEVQNEKANRMIHFDHDAQLQNKFAKLFIKPLQVGNNERSYPVVLCTDFSNKSRASSTSYLAKKTSWSSARAPIPRKSVAGSSP